MVYALLKLFKSVSVVIIIITIIIIIIIIIVVVVGISISIITTVVLHSALSRLPTQECSQPSLGQTERSWE